MTESATKSDKIRPIELLAPARDAEVGKQAILHGADAVYIGAPSHGARKSAANSVEDLARLADFAHCYRARVYATVNTLVYERELREVERLIRRLYLAGVDALIVQDMGILRLDIPPIELHASTQCDTRTPAKAKFLEEVGFSQIVLARELTLREIEAICQNVTVPVECFVHGALCVSYSGRCSASYQACGRSANRGECSQMCRLPYTLFDADGRPIVRDKHLLSLRDFNASASLGDMLRAGVSSFKIEGRLKEATYVKNITAYYRRLIDAEIESHPELYRRSSVGESSVDFEPNPTKSFNRGFTDYFLTRRRNRGIISPDTPKSLGETIESAKLLKPGDGISFIDSEGVNSGAYFNGIAPDGTIITSSGRLCRNTPLRRTFDKEWEKKLSGDTADRRVAVDITLSPNSLSAIDQRGCNVCIPFDAGCEEARKPFDARPFLAKLGNTIYTLRNFQSLIPDNIFIPASVLSDARRRLTDALDSANRATLPLALRRPENREAKYPHKELTYADNVANTLAESFYRQHGVGKIEPALECRGTKGERSRYRVMTTRHCILRELGCCLHPERADKAERSMRPALRQLSKRPVLPLRLSAGTVIYRLGFDCDRCEMYLTEDPGHR